MDTNSRQTVGSVRQLHAFLSMKEKAFVHRYGKEWRLEFLGDLWLAMYFPTLRAAKAYAKETKISLKRASGCDDANP